MLRRQRGGRRRPLSSVWSSVSNVRPPSGRLEANGDSVLRRHGTGISLFVVIVKGRSGKSYPVQPLGLSDGQKCPRPLRRGAHTGVFLLRLYWLVFRISPPYAYYRPYGWYRY